MQESVMNFFEYYRLDRKERKREFYKALNGTLLHISFRSIAMKCLVYSCMRYKISRTNKPEEKKNASFTYDFNCSLQFASVQKVYIRMEIVERLSSLYIFHFWLAQSSIPRRRVGRFFFFFPLIPHLHPPSHTICTQQ